jgi:hypothetical protein
MSSPVAGFLPRRSCFSFTQDFPKPLTKTSSPDIGRIPIHGDQQRGIKKNSKKARQWCEKAADNDHGRAMEELVWCYTQAAEIFPRNPHVVGNNSEK